MWQNAAIRVLMTAPIFFWRNSDLFLKKEHFSSSKIEEIRAFSIKLSEFHWKIFLKFQRFFLIGLTLSIFELEKCSFLEAIASLEVTSSLTQSLSHSLTHSQFS